MSELDQNLRDFSTLAQMRSSAAGIDEDPEKASRAFELEDAFGAPAQAIYSDVEGYEKTFKDRLSNHIIQNNPHLQNYLNAHPLHAVISNDDIGQLDAVSEKMRKLSPDKAVMSKFFSGFAEGFGDPSTYGSWQQGPAGPEWDRLSKQYPISSQLWTALGIAPETLIRGFTGAIEGTRQGLEEGYKQLGGSETGAKEFSADTAGAIEQHLMGLSGVHAPHVPPEFAELARAVEPWAKAGREPPVGVHPIIDKIKSEQSRSDVKSLYEALQESQASATRERNPEVFAKFLREHTTAKIGISADAVRELYGDTRPEAEDGKLGWVPDIESQLRAAEPAGGDIEVPLADWLAKMDPELAKEMKDFIRVRAGGLTLREIEELPKAEKTVVRAQQEGEEPKPIEGEIISPSSPKVQQAIDRLKAWLPINERNGPDPIMRRNIQMLERGGKVAEMMAEHTLKIWAEPPTRALEAPTIEGEVAPQQIAPPIDVVRKSASLEPVFEKAEVQQALGETVDLEGGYTGVFPTEELIGKDEEVANTIGDIIRKMAPDLYGFIAHRINSPTGTKTTGRYVGQRKADKYKAYLVVSLESDDPKHTALHEVMHHLRQGYFTESEWRILAKHAVMSGWVDKIRTEGTGKGQSIAQRYASAPEWMKIEEAVADGYGDWVKGKNVLPEPVQKLFERIKDFFQKIKEGLKEVFGYEPTAEDLFAKAKRGEIGSRVPDERQGTLGPISRTAKEAEPELPGITRLEDRELFKKANAIGMTVKQYKRYQELITQRDAEDVEAMADRRAKSVAKRATKEWRDGEASIRPDVEADIHSRPDISADRFLREGILYDEKIKGRPRLNADELTPEQKAAIPKDYYKSGGIHPDDVAGLFGYDSGKTMVDRLAELEKERKEQGIGPQGYITKLVDAEVDARMRKQHGDPEEALLDELKDQAISQTQMELLHEEVLALGMRAHGEISIKADDLKSWAKNEFDNSPVSKHSTDKYLAQAGKAGRKAELALLEDRPADAFKAKQEQYLSMLLAGEAKKLDKTTKQFEKNAKRYAKRESNLPEEYTNFIHDVLLKASQPIKRSIQDLEERQKALGWNTLEDFVTDKTNNEGLDMPVSEFLFDQNYKKTPDEMTAAEFTAVHNSIKTLIKNGQAAKRVDVNGQRMDLNKLVEAGREMIERLEPKIHEVAPSKFGGLKGLLKTVYWAHINAESVMNRWALGDPRNVMNQLIQGIVSGGEYRTNLLKKYIKIADKLPKIEDPHAKLDNTIFMDPDEAKYGVQRPLPLTRSEGIAILANVGNPSNLNKLASGYNLKPEQVLDWAVRNMRKADWDWMQKRGDKINSPLKKEADRNATNASDVPAPDIPLEPIVIPAGVNPDFPNGATYKGWYHRISKHEIWEGKVPVGKLAIESPYYARAATPRNYEKDRTGHIAPLSLDFGRMEAGMIEMIHDIAFREPVRELAKVFRNEDFRRAVRRHYSPIVMDNLRDWLVGVSNAGSNGFTSKSAATFNKWVGYFRTNVVGNLIQFNPFTVAKHFSSAFFNSAAEVGPVNLARAYKGMLASDPATMKKNWELVASFDEIQRRHQTALYTMSGLDETEGLHGARGLLSFYGSAPVAVSDMISAGPQGLAAYELSLAKYGDDGLARQDANRAIRRAHGSSAITNRPLVMMGSPLAQQYTSLYGFFSGMAQRQFEIAWRAKEGARSVKEGEYAKAWEHYSKYVVPLVFTSVIIPAYIEEKVSGTWDEKGQGLGEKGLKLVFRGLMAPYIGLRDLMFGIESGRDTLPGLIGTGLKEITDLVRVGKEAKQRGITNKKTISDLIEKVPAATGAATGVGGVHLGKAAAGAQRYATGQEHPKDFWEFMRLLGTGHAKEQRR